MERASFGAIAPAMRGDGRSRTAEAVSGIESLQDAGAFGPGLGRQCRDPLQAAERGRRSAELHLDHHGVRHACRHHVTGAGAGNLFSRGRSHRRADAADRGQSWLGVALRGVYTAALPPHNRRMDSRQHAPLPVNPVGDLLRGWRNRRAMSQADLAFEAGISIKHLSYVETGKAAGSRDILLQLASALGLSLRDRNALLEAGGFARQYGERDLSAPEVADAKRAIDLLLKRHEPFPAIVTDRRWNVLQANSAAVRLMTMLLGEARMQRPLNHMRMFLAPDELRPFVENWPKVAAALLVRARHEAMAAPLDLALQSTWRELLKLPDLPVPQFNEQDTPGPLCEVRLRKGSIAVGLIGTVLTLGTPQDITLQELRVEMFMPADAASEATLVKLGRRAR